MSSEHIVLLIDQHGREELVLLDDDALTELDESVGRNERPTGDKEVQSNPDAAAGSRGANPPSS